MYGESPCTVYIDGVSGARQENEYNILIIFALQPGFYSFFSYTVLKQQNKMRKNSFLFRFPVSEWQ